MGYFTSLGMFIGLLDPVYSKWEKVFSIRPVKTLSGQTVFLKDVMKRSKRDSIFDWEEIYEYKTIEEYNLEQLIK